MNVATWFWKDVQPLLAAAEAAKAFSVSMEDMFDPKMRKDGKAPPKDVWPSAEDVDESKLVPGLTLVGDQGIYLLTNVKDEEMIEVPGPNGQPVKRRRLAYARESNPDTMEFEDWYGAKRCIFGGDDGSMFFPASMFRSVRAAMDKAGVPADKGVIAAKFTSQHVQLYGRLK